MISPHTYKLFIALLILASCKPTHNPPSKKKKKYQRTQLEVIQEKDLPSWVQEFDLAMPYSVAYQDEGRFVLKSSFSLKRIEQIYEERMIKQKFKVIEQLVMQNSLLKQYKRNKTVISIEVSKLPYSSNHIIRLGISQVK